MIKPVNNISVRTIAIILIGLMNLMILDKALFLHTHKLNDGTIIVHAHPFNKSADSKPFKTHHHSNSIFHFYHIVNLLFPAIILTFALILTFKKNKHLFVQIKKISRSYTFRKKGRAPPVFSCRQMMDKLNIIFFSDQQVPGHPGSKHYSTLLNM
jgi:hypothetical protein